MGLHSSLKEDAFSIISDSIFIVDLQEKEVGEVKL
jgi:hypothetical protein